MPLVALESCHQANCVSPFRLSFPHPPQAALPDATVANAAANGTAAPAGGMGGGGMGLGPMDDDLGASAIAAQVGGTRTLAVAAHRHAS